jgi:hypothetical protein
MYSPGNSVVVNLLMRWPALVPPAICCAVILNLPKEPDVPVLQPDPIVIEIPAPEISVEQLPVLPIKKKGKG